jgi:glycosyltransferase involved in cell wall biosynthesis
MLGMDTLLSISFCTTCMNRKHHLERTLLSNLQVMAQFDGVALVLLDYGSNDNVLDFVLGRYKHELSVGRLRYFRVDGVRVFRHAHAKNIAHRLAEGDVVCNLDADNFLTREYIQLIRLTINPEGGVIIAPKGNRGGTFGRIALLRSDFCALRGYNELLSHGWGYEDNEFIQAARWQGYQVIEVDHEMYGIVAIQHSDIERVANCFVKQRTDSFRYHQTISRTLTWRGPESKQAFGVSRVRTLNGDTFCL